MVSFSCETKDIKAAIKHIRVAIPKSRKERIKSRIEIDIKPDKVILSVIGASYHIYEHTGIFAKIFMPVVLLIKAVEVTKLSRFVMECKNGMVRFGGTEISSPEIEIGHPENQSKIDLSMNYKVLDLLQLRNQYPVTELRRMGLLEKLLKAEEKMIEDLETASEMLWQYGISYEELRGLVEKKVNKKT